MYPPDPDRLKACSDFFFLFARFEYAMKTTGYRTPARRAEPCWDSLARDFNLDECPETVAKAASYLLQNRPFVQIVEDEALAWRDVPANKGTNEKDLLAYVRRVRNNLLH